MDESIEADRREIDITLIRENRKDRRRTGVGLRLRDGRTKTVSLAA